MPPGLRGPASMIPDPDSTGQGAAELLKPPTLTAAFRMDATRTFLVPG